VDHQDDVELAVAAKFDALDRWRKIRLREGLSRGLIAIDIGAAIGHRIEDILWIARHVEKRAADAARQFAGKRECWIVARENRPILLMIIA
jgi:hypothetical protein